VRRSCPFEGPLGGAWTFSGRGRREMTANRGRSVTGAGELEPLPFAIQAGWQLNAGRT
jgi:hypothetical protein